MNSINFDKTPDNVLFCVKTLIINAMSKMVLYNLLCTYSGGGNIHYYPSPQLGNISLQADGRACGYLRRGKDIRLYILRYL